MFENSEMCAKCGGKCCKQMPGCCFPEDFGVPLRASVKAALASGRYTIDWWEGDPRKNIQELTASDYIRPATKGKEGRLTDPSWGGECTFLTETGCSLSADNRPTGCKMLEPKDSFPEGCKGHPGSEKREAAIAWISYQDMLAEIRQKLEID